MVIPKEKTPDKDLAALRREHQQLAGTINRLDLLRLAFLVVLVIALSSAFEKMHFVGNARIDSVTSDLMQKLAEIRNPYPNQALEFDPTPFLAGYCPNWERYVKRLLGNSSYDEAKLQSSAKEISGMVETLCGLYQQAFTFSLDASGFKVELDLRHWGISLPFLYWFWGIYRQLLRKKLQAVRQLGQHLVTTAPAGQVLILDQLVFSSSPKGDSPYTRLPWSFARPFYLLATAAAFAYLTFIWKPFWALLNELILFQAAQFVLICISLHLAYRYRVSQKLQAQLSEITGQAPKSSRSALRQRLDSTFQRWKRLQRWMKSSRTHLVSGSVLVLVSLFLMTSTDGCNNYTGYQLARGKAHWVGGALADGFWQKLSDILGKDIYIVALALAVVTVLLVALSLRSPALLQRRKVLAAMFVTAMIVSSFLLTQISFVFLPSYLNGMLGLVWVLYWIAQVVVWFRFAYSIQARGIWPGRHILLSLYLPQVAGPIWCAALSFPAGDDSVPGLGCYFVGAHLLTVGYLQLLYRCFSAASPQATAAASAVGRSP